MKYVTGQIVKISEVDYEYLSGWCELFSQSGKDTCTNCLASRIVDENGIRVVQCQNTHGRTIVETLRRILIYQNKDLIEIPNEDLRYMDGEYQFNNKTSAVEYVKFWINNYWDIKANPMTDEELDALLD